MKKIIVRNFAMIRYQELDLDANLNIIIGPQASGKSTLMKLIFFCRKLRDYLLAYLTNPNNFQNVDPSRRTVNLNNYLKRRFMDYFGTTRHMPRFEVRFYFNVEANRYVTLTLDENGYLHFSFEETMWRDISSYLRQTERRYQKALSGNFPDYTYLADYTRNYYTHALGSLFDDWEELIYVPAGRNILAILSDAQLTRTEALPAESMQSNLYPPKSSDDNAPEMDMFFQDFIRLIRFIRPRFGVSLSEVIQEYSLMQDYTKEDAKRRPGLRNAELAIPIIKSVLKADYRYDPDGEKLFYTEQDYVKLMFASSGQQEVLWILLLIFLKILEDRHVFLVLEEPESHLFPEAQKHVVELVALLIHSTNSHVVITTHSPYILTSANLCAYSAKVENDSKGEQSREPVVAAHLRVSPDKYDAFMTNPDEEQGENAPFLTRIKDEDGLTDATKIDGVSDEINEQMDELIELEVRS